MQDAILSGDSGALNSTKYKKLDELLNQTDMYTQFLMEQMKEGDSKDETAPEAEAEDGKVGSKRKAGKTAGKAVKRQKPTSATQVCLDIKQSVIFQISMMPVCVRNAHFCVCPHFMFCKHQFHV